MSLTIKDLEQLDSFLKNGSFNITGEGAAVLHKLRTKLAEEHQALKAAEKEVQAQDTSNERTTADSGDSGQSKPDKRRGLRAVS